MKVALIGDVHGNLPALEAVLADADRRGCEAVWNIGDFVGYGAFPDEVVRLLRNRAVTNLIGNYDQKALRFREKDATWHRKKRREKWLAFKFAWEHLSRPSRKWLASLPEQQRLDVAGRRILLCHGSPASVDEHLWPETADARFRELAAMAEADIVVCGHSHQAFVREVGGVVFINTGTVGRPDDGDPRACYAVLDVTPRRLRVAHHRVAYDTERAVAALREAGLPEAFAEMVLRGRSLDGLDPTP